MEEFTSLNYEERSTIYLTIQRDRKNNGINVPA